MPEHGTKDCYNGGCRCRACKDAKLAYWHKRHREKAMESWGAKKTYFVDAEPVREHVAKLLKSGHTMRGISRDYGVSLPSISHLMRSHPRTGKPVVSMKRENAEVLMAIEPLRKAIVCPVCSREIGHNDSMYWDGIHLRCYVATRGGTEEQMRMIAAADRKAESRKRKEASCFTS